MKRLNWQLLLGLSLVALSAFFYFVHYLIFRDAHHIFIYLVGDIAFVPVEVLLVTMIIHRLLETREKRHKLEKLNMVIETFFSETGTALLNIFSVCDPGLDHIRGDLIIRKEWSDREFAKVAKRVKNHAFGVDIVKVDLDKLRDSLSADREFLLRLLQNPVLLEHESFTDLLRAVFHLTEELASRDDLGRLPRTDLDHLAGDIKRAYGRLVYEWLAYMKYLRADYPYLFSLAMRKNPFDRTAAVIVK